MLAAHPRRVRAPLALTAAGVALLAGCATPSTQPQKTPASQGSGAGAERLAANKRVALDFYDLAVNQKNVRAAAAKYIGPVYIQHNPTVADGAAATIAFMEARYRTAPTLTAQVVRAVAEDDLVVLHSLAKNTPADRGTVFVNIWRVKDGKLVEHWDAIQPVPPTSANSHGMT